jgi:hypothetical protein
MLDMQNNEEHEKYIQSIKALNNAGKYSEFHKVPVTPEEIEFKKNVDRGASRNSFSMHFTSERYNKIFNKE